VDASVTAALGLGFLLGLRHALDADHVAAVTAMVSHRCGLVRSCLLGTFWGAGHTSALLVAATLVLSLKLTISPDVERGLEVAVAAMLVLLGGHVALTALAVLTIHGHAHVHADGVAHRHLHVHVPGAHEHDHSGLLGLGGRPFLIGMVHGLAGSAGLMLLVLGAMPTVAGGLLYVLVFGIGSTAGMLLLSGLISIPFAMLAVRSVQAHAMLQALAGLASLVLGAVLALRLVGGA
jgi:hypothetical protein